MLRRDPNERLSAQECLDHGVMRLLQSGKLPTAEEHLKTADISSTSFSNSQVNVRRNLMTSHVDIEDLFPTALGSLIDHSDNSVAEYDPGVEEAVAWNTQDTNKSKTPVPLHKSQADIPQPVPYGLVLAETNGDGVGNQQEVEVEDAAAKQCQKSRTGAIAGSRGNLPPHTSPALNPSGLAVAGSRRVRSAHQRNGNMASKGPASSSVKRRKPSISGPANENAAAHALLQLKSTR